MPVRRVEAMPKSSRQRVGRVQGMAEYQDAIKEIERGIGPCEQIEILLNKASVKKAKLATPSVSLVHALQHYIEGRSLTYQVIQRRVAGELWPRIYITAK